MEKRRPHYDLKTIQVQMNSVDAMNMTLSARNGIEQAGMKLKDAWTVIQKLSMSNFYKSMTVHADSRVWQDVYYAQVAPERMSQAYSVHTFAGMLGSAAAPTAVLLMHSLYGWRGCHGRGRQPWRRVPAARPRRGAGRSWPKLSHGSAK